MNPLVARSGIAFLKRLKKHNFKEIGLSNKFREELNDYFKLNNLDIFIQGYCSISRIIFTKKKISNKWDRIHEENNSKISKIFYNKVAKIKVIYPNNGLMFHSAIYTKKDFDNLKKIIIDCVNS